MSYFDSYRTTLNDILDRTSATTLDAAELGPADGFIQWLDLTRATNDAGHVHYFAGNGASATMASEPQRIVSGASATRWPSA